MRVGGAGGQFVAGGRIVPAVRAAAVRAWRVRAVVGNGSNRRPEADPRRAPESGPRLCGPRNVLAVAIRVV